jgi:broad specificity phosphatase PhoE
MIFILVTHARPDYGASGVLMDEGRQGAQLLAEECRERLPKNAVVVSILSSPRIRCIETAIILAGELSRGFKESGINGERREHGKPWDDIPATRIYVQEELDEQFVAFDTDNLRSTIETGYEVAKPQIEKLSARKEEITPVVIVALHGDLANALNMQDRKFATLDEDKKGFFFDRQPVLAMVNYTPGQKLSEPVLRGPINDLRGPINDAQNPKYIPLSLGNFDITEPS